MTARDPHTGHSMVFSFYSCENSRRTFSRVYCDRLIRDHGGLSSNHLGLESELRLNSFNGPLYDARRGGVFC